MTAANSLLYQCENSQTYTFQGGTNKPIDFVGFVWLNNGNTTLLECVFSGNADFSGVSYALWPGAAAGLVGYSKTDFNMSLLNCTVSGKLIMKNFTAPKGAEPYLLGVSIALQNTMTNSSTYLMNITYSGQVVSIHPSGNMSVICSCTRAPIYYRNITLSAGALLKNLEKGCSDCYKPITEK